MDNATPEGKKAIEILEYSIPEEERADMGVLRSMLPEAYDLVEWSLMDSDRTVGYCAFIRSSEVIFGLYLAIDSELRGKGYGSKALDMMFGGSHSGFPAFFGVETPDDKASNNQQRLARIRLYERFGFRVSDIKMKNRFNGIGMSIMWNAKTEEEKGLLFDIIEDMMIKGGAYEMIADP